MEKLVTIGDNKYEIIKNYKNGFDKDEFISKCTDYFYDFDYVVMKMITKKQKILIRLVI